MSAVEQLILNQLHSIITGQNAEIDSVDSARLSELLTLSAEHSVTPLVAESLSRQGLLQDSVVAESYRHISYLSFIKWQQQEAELHKITDLFEAQQIDNIPLKGAVIRNFYPEPWMRTSCDIDILVRAEQLDAAEKILVSSLDYKRRTKTGHDILLVAPNGVHLELHYDFDEKEISAEKLWETAIRSKGDYQYALAPEYFILHHVAHMAKHFILGGCGIRSLIDLWLIQKNMSCDEKKLEQILTSCGLQKFMMNISSLVSTWMNGEAFTDMQNRIIDYIIFGGVYGNMNNRIAVSQTVKKKGFFCYTLSKVFLSREALERIYPILKKQPWLYSFCQVHRWFRVFRVKKFKALGRDIKQVRELDSDKLNETELILWELGL